MDYVMASDDFYAHIGAHLPFVVVVNCFTGLKCRPVLHHDVVILLWSSGFIECS